MTAYEWFELFAICALLVIGVTWLTWVPNADDDTDRQRWQDTTRARTADDVKRDLAEAEAAAFDLAECIAIWDATQHDIPHQTRRTEEDQ